VPSSSRIFIVDDDEAIVDSLVVLFEAHGLEAQGFSSGSAFLSACDAGANGCVLIDVHMPEMDGLTLQQEVTRRWPALAIIVMTGAADVGTAVRAMKAGALDFIEKPIDETVLLDTVREALAKSREVATATSEVSEIRQRLALLSIRERDVLNGLVTGLPNKTIAYDLSISARTVEIYRSRLMKKMQAKSLSELVRLAVAAGVKPK
jgi:two-component system, LuxR family, response regulator FixJ